MDPDSFLDERSALSPVSHYARMKIAAEEALYNQLSRSFAPTILRLATVFGHSYRPRFDLVVNKFARDAFLHNKISVFGGTQWRPNVHVRDVAKAIKTVIELPLANVGKKVFNVGSEQANHTIHELAKYTQAVFPNIEVDVESQNTDTRNYRITSDRLRDATGFAPTISVREGLEEIKQVLTSKEINDPGDRRYSNIDSLIEASDEARE